MQTYTKPNLANWLLSGTIRSKILSCGQSVLGSGGRACVPKHYGYHPEISGADTGRLERKMWLLNVVRAAGNRWWATLSPAASPHTVQGHVGTELPLWRRGEHSSRWVMILQVSIVSSEYVPGITSRCPQSCEWMSVTCCKNTGRSKWCTPFTTVDKMKPVMQKKTEVAERTGPESQGSP